MNSNGSVASRSTLKVITFSCMTKLHQADAISSLTLWESVALSLCLPQCSVIIMNCHQREERSKSCEISKASCFLLPQRAYFTVRVDRSPLLWMEKCFYLWSLFICADPRVLWVNVTRPCDTCCPFSLVSADSHILLSSHKEPVQSSTSGCFGIT